MAYTKHVGYSLSLENIPFSQFCPVHPGTQEQVSGRTQVPPFRQPPVQIAELKEKRHNILKDSSAPNVDAGPQR